MSLLEILGKTYRFFFGRRVFFRFNRLLHFFALKGMGVLNSENSRVSGERAFLKRLAAWREGRDLMAIDVGANEGDYSSELKRLFPAARVIAFEPNPPTFARLKTRAASEGFEAVQAGCHNRPGHLKIWDYASGRGSSHASLYADVIGQLHGGKVKAFKVPLVALDGFMRQRHIARLHLLKIDTEGNEFKVLEGARKALKRGQVEVVQFEFNEMNVYSRVFLKDFLQLLAGYHLYRLLPDGPRDLGPYHAATHEIFALQNLVAVHRESDFLKFI